MLEVLVVWDDALGTEGGGGGGGGGALDASSFLSGLTTARVIGVDTVSDVGASAKPSMSSTSQSSSQPL